MAVLGRSVSRVKNWKRQGPFFGGIPWAGVAVGGDDRARSATGGAGAVETAQAAPIQKCFFAKASFSFLVHNLLWQSAQLEYPNTHYQDFQAEGNEPFLHSVTISVTDWQGVGAGPALSARTNNISGALELPWHCVFS